MKTSVSESQSVIFNILNGLNNSDVGLFTSLESPVYVPLE